MRRRGKRLNQDLLNTIPESCKQKVELTDEATNLADCYIQEKVVGRTSRDDCFHIALATIIQDGVIRGNNILYEYDGSDWNPVADPDIRHIMA
ncbi:hypothetical protein FACS1894155_12970 [Bacteroidia bacterium]|nr:hypothetical protein FACS1894155_12970 [Bacteroidia bacterium]